MTAHQVAAGRLRRCCEIFAGLSPHELAEAESSLRNVREMVRTMAPYDANALRPQIETCSELARRANQLWERRRASINEELMDRASSAVWHG